MPAQAPAAHSSAHTSSAAPQPAAVSGLAGAPAGGPGEAGGLQVSGEPAAAGPLGAGGGDATLSGAAGTGRFDGMEGRVPTMTVATPGQSAFAPASHPSAEGIAIWTIGLLLFVGTVGSIALTLRLGKKVTRLAAQLENVVGAGLSNFAKAQTSEITRVIDTRHRVLVSLCEQLVAGVPVKGGPDLEPVTAARSTASRSLMDAPVPGFPSVTRGRHFEPIPDDVLKGLDLGNGPERSSQPGRGGEAVTAAPRAPEPPRLNDNELLSEVQKLAMDVFIDERPASAEGLTKAILRRASPSVAHAINSANLQVSAHSAAASLTSEFQDPDFLSVTRVDHTGWLVPNLRADYARTYVTMYEGEIRNWPHFSEPALCTLDGSGRAKVVRRGRL